jgi:hypothetical protein
VSRSRSRVIDVGLIAALALVVALLLWPLSQPGRALAGIDALTYFTPYRDYGDAAIREGRIPLWNPYLFLGAPFLANSQAGVFYPLNWLLSSLSAPRALAWSAILHVWLAAVFAYAYARRSLGLGRLAAWTAGVVFALCGHLGAQVEHSNQLAAIVCLPLLLLLVDLSTGRLGPSEEPLTAGLQTSLAGTLLLALVIAIQLLVGHSQSSFISLTGMLVYCLYIPVRSTILTLRQRCGNRSRLRATMRLWLRSLVPVLLAVLLGFALAAVQLVPTWELSRLSIRSGGLSYREAVSFSLKPRMMLYTLLPVFNEGLGQAHGTEAFTEYVSYVGVVALAIAAFGACVAWRRVRARQMLTLVAMGLFLAMGVYNPVYYVLHRVVPGFAMFRAPARWMLLYAFGASMLAGFGIEHLGKAVASPRDLLGILRRRSAGANGIVASGALLLSLALVWMRKPGPVTILSWLATGVVALLCIRGAATSSRWRGLTRVVASLVIVLELLLASRVLPHATPTTIEAVTSARPAVTHMLSDDGLHRFLSLSDTSFDPGDLDETRSLHEGHLSEQEVYELVVAQKQQEILAPNLPLLHRISAVDGYDGGILPTARYVRLQMLFLSEDEVSVDGRLREQLETVPSPALLDLLNVKYVITDKLGDLWSNDVYYDLQLGAVMDASEEELVLDVSAPLEATSVGVVYRSEVLDEAFVAGRVGQIRLVDEVGHQETLDLAATGARSGANTAQPVLLDFSRPLKPVMVALSTDSAGVRLVVDGISLVDKRTGAHTALTVSPGGRLQRVHSGDVKVYENTGVLDRAFVVHSTQIVADDHEALAALLDPSFDPRVEVVLQEPLTGTPLHQAIPDDVQLSPVQVQSYEAERVVIRADLDRPGFLVLSDTWYPGWQARVDGVEQPVLRANLNFRAIQLDAGRHTVEFVFHPVVVRIGAGISLSAVTVLLALGMWLIVLVVLGSGTGQQRQARV